MAYNFSEISILVVEDNKPMVELIRSLLTAFGVGNIYHCYNGEEGFNVFCKETPDIVITDWMMSPTDGITLSKMIRNDRLSPNQFVPIILMTGFSEQRRVTDARDSGVTEFLVKPFSARDLYKRLAQIIERPRQFVRCEDFFGPDRRRKREEKYNGVDRRGTENRGQASDRKPIEDNENNENNETDDSGKDSGDRIYLDI